MTIFFEVASNPTTGYVWQYAETDECEGVIQVEDKYTMDREANETGMTGVGGTHVFAVTGLIEGGECGF